MFNAKENKWVFNSLGGRDIGALCAAITMASLPTLSHAEGKSYAIEEVQVTARKVEESLQDTPVAVSAFGEHEIKKLNAQDLRDIGGHSPNVSIGSIPGFNAAAIAIRGVSTGDIPSSFDPAVTVAVDGFYYGHAQTSILDMFDLQQIEILRGPQGTLFGKNTIGGVVNVTTKRPTEDLGGEVELKAGNFGQTEVKAAVNVPLVENTLMARLAYMNSQSDGYFKNTVDGGDIGGRDVETVRGRILFTPNDTFEALLSFEWEKDRSDTPPVINTSTSSDPNGYYGGDLFYGFGYPGRGTGGELSRPLGDPFDSGLVPRSHHVAGFADYTGSTGHFFDIDGVYLNMSWDVGVGTITSTTGQRSVDSDLYNDYVGEDVPIYATMRSVYRDTFSQEIRFASSFSETFDFQVGVYYQLNENDYINHTSLGSGHPFSGIAWPATGLLLTGDGGQETKSTAVFGEANIQLTDQLGMTVGARYSEEEKDFDLRPIGVPDDNRVLTSDKWDSLTYRLGFDYRVNDDVMFYATFSTGFKSGGFNEQATSPATAAFSFDEEQADAFEIGMKSEFFERRLRLNVAAFYTEYNDLQLDSVVPVSGSEIGQESVITNAGASIVQGLEVEAIARVTEYVTLQATLGLLDSEYDEFACDLDRDPSNGNEDCTVLDVKRTPEVTASGGVTIEQPVALGAVNYHLNATYTDSYYNDIFNSLASEHEDVLLLNGSVTFYDAQGRYRISVYGRNLTDEEYQSSGLGVANLWSFSTYGAPRTFGLEVGFDF